MIKVAVVDDQPLLLQGLSMIVGVQKDMMIAWTASNGNEAVFNVTQNQPDVILMDIRMPEMNGVQATEKIKALYPAINILILTTFMEDEEIYESLKLGASGYLLKDATPEVIVDAIRKAMTGGTVIDPSVASKLLKHLKSNTASQKDLILDKLTPRELDIARAISEGQNNKEIAEKLYVSEGTVKNHLTSILEKLDLRDRTQLAIAIIKSEL